MNDTIANDDDVFIDLLLPAVPRVGELLLLTREQKANLENMLKSKPCNILHYIDWIYGESSNAEDLSEVNLDDICFDDVMSVETVTYRSMEDFVRIELSN